MHRRIRTFSPLTRRLVLFLAEYFFGSRGTGSTVPPLDNDREV